MTDKPICLLDLGGVVFQATGASNDQIDWVVISELNRIYGLRFNIGEDVFPQFMADYNSKTGQKLSGSKFLELLWQTLEFNEELVLSLSHNYNIVIVSDNYRENIAYISKLFNFKDWSVDQYYSFDFELEKSDPKFFERLIKKTGWRGEDLIFIDDSHSKLDSAALQGIKGFLSENNEKLFADIDSHLH